MGAFKPASSPGRFAGAPQVDNVSRLLKKQTKDRNDQVNYNKQLADTHREYAKSFDFGIEVEGKSRQNALQFEDYFRKIDQQFQLQGIQNAQQSAIRNAEQNVAQVNKDTESVINLVNKTLDTGVDIYKQREAAIQKQQTNDLQSLIIRNGLSTEDLYTARSLEKGMVRDAGYTDTRISGLEAKGLSRSDIESIIGIRSDVFDLSVVNSQRREILDLSWGMYGTGIPIPGFGDKTADDLRGDPTGTAAAYNHHLQLALRRWGDPDLAALYPAIEKGRAAALGPSITLSNREAAAKQQHDATQHLFNTIQAGAGSPQSAAKLTAEQININPNGAYKLLDNLKTLAGVHDSGVNEEFLNNLGDQQLTNSKGEPIGMTVRQKFGVQLDEVRDAYFENMRGDQSNLITQKKQNALPLISDLQDLRRNDVKLSDDEARLLLDKANKLDITETDRNKIKELLNGRRDVTEGTTERSRNWMANLEAVNPYFLGVTNDKLRENSSSEKEYQNWQTRMHTARGRDSLRNTFKKESLNQLKRRINITNGDTVGLAGLHLAHDHAMADYDQRRLRLGSTMDQGKAHTEAYALFTNDLGDPKDALNGKGIYGVVNLKDGPSPQAWSNSEFNPESTADVSRYLYAEDLAKEIGTIKNVGARGKAGANLSSVQAAVDKGALTDFLENYGEWPTRPDKELQDQLNEFRKATGLPTVWDAAQVLANEWGLEIKDPPAEIRPEIREIIDRHGPGAARQITEGAPTRGQGERPSYVTHDHAYGEIPNKDLATVAGPVNSIKMYKEVAPHLQRMVDDAAEAGHTLKFNSGYRSGPEQQHLFETKPAGIAAPRGTSEHELGYSVDLHYSDAGYKWLQQNAHKYGFQPFAEGLGADDPEAWHWTFRGVSRANKLNTPITVQSTTDTPAMNIEHELPDFPEFKVIESSTGEHMFNVKKPNGEWVQYPANLKNTEALRENHRDVWLAYNRIVNKGGIQR